VWPVHETIGSQDGPGQVVKRHAPDTDLEERKRVEEVPRLKEQSLRLIFDTLPGFVCTLSAAGEIELVNRQVLEYFGKAAEELKN
jgi:PAS domain-containing protein